MAKEVFYIVFLKLSSIPLIFIANFIYILRLNGFKNDLDVCYSLINHFLNMKLDKKLIDILIISEDRRNKIHCGVDAIGILRALKLRYTKNIIQGASTIEQQFVRVATQKYEKTFYRKFREQMLAILISQKFYKSDIAKTYLLIAHYGYNLDGIVGIKKISQNKLLEISQKDAIEIISRLKYPQPEKINLNWLEKNQFRIRYISKLLDKK